MRGIPACVWGSMGLFWVHEEVWEICGWVQEICGRVCWHLGDVHGVPRWVLGI